MNVLITGATGLVGQELIPELLRFGHSVTALARDPKAAEKKLGNKIKIVSWDGEKGPPPPRAFEGIDAVIHLAGENVAGKRWTEARKKALYDSRVKSADNLREGIKKAGIDLKVFISASGIGFYGDRKDQKLTESEPAGADFLAKLCVDWEAAADGMPAKRIVKLRFGAVLKKGAGFLGEIVPMFKKLGASRLGDGKQWITWIHIDDLVDALIFALTEERVVGPVNTIAPEAVTNAEMTESIRKAVRAWKGPPAPRFALRLLFGELADVLLYSQRAVPKKLEEWRFKFEYPKLRDALDDLLVD